MEIIEIGFSPIIWLMQQILNLLWPLTGSAGTAVVLLSCLVALLTIPIRAWASKIETKVRDKKQIIDQKIAIKAVGLKGEDRFRVIEAIYEENKYHPIQSIALGLSFLVMLPFLISALFLLTGNSSLIDVPYLFIPDLSQPDGLLSGFNLLPIVMSAVTLIDAKIRFANDSGMFLRFCFIAGVLLILVYSLSSALVLYWTVSNLISMITYQATSRRNRT